MTNEERKEAQETFDRLVERVSHLFATDSKLKGCAAESAIAHLITAVMQTRIACDDASAKMLHDGLDAAIGMADRILARMAADGPPDEIAATIGLDALTAVERAAQRGMEDETKRE